MQRPVTLRSTASSSGCCCWVFFLSMDCGKGGASHSPAKPYSLLFAKWQASPTGKEDLVGGAVWSPANSHSPHIFQECNQIGREACCVVSSLYNISSKIGLCRCPFLWAPIHLSGSLYGQECSKRGLLGWHTAISPLSVSRATGLPCPTRQQ